MKENISDPVALIANLEREKALLERQVEALQSNLELQQNQSRVLAVMLRDAPVAMVMIDEEMSIHLSNGQAQALLSVDPQRDASAPLLDRIMPDDHASLRFVCEQALDGKLAQDIEVRSADGERVMMARATRLAGGKFLLTLFDITMHVRAEHERRRRDHQAHQARMLRALGLLAGSVAHDINNVLGAITAMTGCVLQELSSQQRGLRHDILSIQEEAMRGQSTTDSLNTIARPPAATSELQPIEEHLEHMVQILGRTTTNDVTVSTHFEAPKAQVHGDQSTYTQMFAALLAHASENALNHIKVSTHIEPDDDSDWVIVTITDDGPPIDDPFLGHLHDPFLSHRALDFDFGLANAHAIASHLGGELRIDRQPTGQTIRLELPLAGELEPEFGSEAPSTLSGFWILVIDDHALINKATCQVLRQAGFKPLSAASGSEGIDLLQKNVGLVRLAIVDMLMPGMDGLTTIQHLKEIDPDLPTLICSGHIGDRDDEVRAMGIPVLSKPWLPDELVEIVRGCLIPALADSGAPMEDTSFGADMSLDGLIEAPSYDNFSLDDLSLDDALQPRKKST